MMKAVDYKGWARYIQLLMGVAGKETRRSRIKGETLLEFACGTGNISLMMSGFGYNVTGMDSSESMLEVARAKLSRRRGKPLRLLCADMVTGSCEGEFDRAVCVYDSINYIPTPEGLRHFFRNAFASLKEGGVFVFDASLESNSLNDASLFVQRGRYKGTYYHRKSLYDPVTKIHKTYVRVRINDEIIEEVHMEYVYQLELIRELFAAAGFVEKFAAGDFTMLEADEKSERVHFVLVKPRHD